MLTSSQLQALKTDILSKVGTGGPLQAAYAAGNDQGIADWYNQPASPVTKVWKPSVSIAELNSAIAWADMVGIPAARQTTYLAMTQAGSIDMTDAQVRQGLVEIFGNGSTSVTGITNVGRRDATNLELLFSTGTTTKTSQVFGQLLTNQDVAQALRG